MKIFSLGNDPDDLLALINSSIQFIKKNDKTKPQFQLQKI